jgi:putative intracellular protease/amidase
MDEFTIYPNNPIELDTLELKPQIKDFIGRVVKAGKPVAAICRGIILLTHSGLLPPEKQIAFSGELNSWDKPTVKLVHKPVVVEGKLITATDWNAAGKFAQEVLMALEKGR